MRECEGCGGSIAGDRAICPDCGTECTAVTAAVGATQPEAAAAPLAASAPGPIPPAPTTPSGPTAAGGATGAGAPWERLAAPVGAVGSAAPGPSLGPPGLAAPGAGAVTPGQLAPTPFSHAPSPRVVVTSSSATASAGAGPSVGTLIGAIASAAITVAALMDWTIAATSFRVPVKVLFDPNATSKNPKLGFFLLAIGLAGLVVSFVSHRARWRVLLGGLSLAIAVLFAVQLQRAVSEHPFLGTKSSLFDVMGAGPWLLGLAGIALAVSAIFDR